jgi:hypothetical protein
MTYVVASWLRRRPIARTILALALLVFVTTSLFPSLSPFASKHIPPQDELPSHQNQGSNMVSTVSGRGALGVNYNERLMWIKQEELRSLGATWLRGFVEMHDLDDPDGPDGPGKPAGARHGRPVDEYPGLRKLLRARQAGFKVILSLKWKYKDLDFPHLGSAAQAAEIRRLRALLPAVMGNVDILVVGNEPFVECRQDQTDERLNAFYETLADEVIAWRRAQPPGSPAATTRLFMGALNRLDLPAKQTPAAQRMLSFIASRPELEGVDLHLHMPTIEGNRAMLDYALARLRPEQTFLATEFSLIWHWKRHMGDAVSDHYRSTYGLPPGTKVIDVIGDAILQPMPYDQWLDFLQHEPWYTNRRNYLSNVVNLYRSTGRLAVATYSMSPMRMRKQPLQMGDNPWMLNGLLVPPTVQAKPDGSKYENYPWAEQFRQLQRP